MSTLFGAIAEGINQDKAQIYGLVNNAISYAQSKKAQKRAYLYARALQKHQYDLTQQGYLESPGNQRQGLEDAGYNPMLALGNVGKDISVAGGTPVGANAVDSPHLAETALNLQHLANESAQTESNVGVNDATEFKTRMEGIAQSIKNNFLNRRESSEIQKTEAETTKLNSDTQYNNAVIDNMKSRLELDRELGYAGLEVQKRGQDKAYNASTYATNVKAETERGIVETRLPFGVGHRGYYTAAERALMRP